MNRDQLRRVIADRFERWGRFLRQEHATPLLIVGLKMPENQFVFTACEGVTGEQLQDMRAASLIAVRDGKVDHR